MKNISQYIVIALLFVGICMNAQVEAVVTIQNQTISASSAEADRLPAATQSIIIKPTTLIQAGSNFHAVISADPYINLSLDDTQNYIFTRSYQTEMSTPSGIINNKDVIEGVTYFDGLGRPKQQIGIKASNDKQDIVTFIDYDEYGRQEKEYLPYEATGTLGSYRTNAESATESFYNEPKYQNTANPFSETAFEPSPLNRVLKQAAPGHDWRMDGGHEIEFGYETNTATEVRLFTITFTNDDTEVPTLTGGTTFYGANELYKTVTYDENHTSGTAHSTEEFKDKQGRVILKRTYASTGSATPEAHDTYYVYDDFGNLTYVIPPKVTVSPTEGVSDTELSELCYQYVYDHRNRLIKKKIPGKGEEYIVYNKLDQPVMTQDANLEAGAAWLFTKYDAFGRVAYTGKISDNRDRDAIQTEANALTGNLWVTTGAPVLIGGATMYYDNGGYPNAQNAEVLTINYYDDYSFLDSEDTVFNNPGTTYNQNITPNTKSLATGSKVKVLSTSFWITTATYYDHKARPIYIVSQNEYLNTTDIAETKMDFVKALESKTTHIKDDNTPIVTIDTFTYDHMGRLLEQNQKIDSQTTEQIVANTYDELGQLVTKEVGGGLQEVDYTYNVRGWLTNINNDAKNDDDLFNFSIKYNDITDSSKKLFNGNISQTSWSTANGTVTDPSTGNPISTSYTYSYDALNRITAATDNTGHYNLTGVSYDKNGNIRTLERQGLRQPNTDDFGVMDNLAYTYDTGNKLKNVIDGSGSQEGFKDGNTSGDDYVYDVNGNMTEDKNKGISNISYNHLNLPTRVIVENVNTGFSSTIQYVYDATGVKLSKKVTDYPSQNTTHYVGGFIYKNSISLGQPPRPEDLEFSLEFFSHPEGYTEPKSSGGFDYIYQYKDHLGNIRLSYSDKDNDGKVDVLRNNVDVDGDGDNHMEILEEKNYYPFGLQHKGYNDTRRGTPHNYGFNGKEENNELGLGWLDFHARSYDASLGRWMNIDPHSENYFSISPYVSFANNPISFVDPTGMDISFWKYNSETSKWETATYDELDEKTQKSLEAFAKTDIGNKFLSKFAKKGDKVGEVEFGEDGEYSKHELAFGETNYWYAPDGSSNVKNKNGKLVFEWAVNNASKRELKKVENLAMSNGHEVFVHFERYLDKLIEAYDSGDMDEVDRLFAEKREISKRNSATNHEDHKKYINGDRRYNRMKTYQTQLKQILNPKAVRQAIIEHDNKFKHLKK